MWAGSPKWVGGDRRSPGGSDGGEGWRRVGVARGEGGEGGEMRRIGGVGRRGRRLSRWCWRAGVVASAIGGVRCCDAMMRWSRWTCWRRPAARRRRQSALAGSVNQANPEPGVGPSPKALSSHSGSLHPCPNSPSFYQSPISNGTYRPVASVASGVSRPDEARSCLRVLSQTPSATQQTAKPNQPQLPHPLHFQHRHPRKDTRSLSLSRQLGAATMFRNNYDNDSVTL